VRWLIAGTEHNEKKTKKFIGLKESKLAAMYYPDADGPALRVCADLVS
jgi:hypothetical protein